MDDKPIAYSNYCVRCYPESERASYLRKGDSLCEKCFVKEKKSEEALHNIRVEMALTQLSIEPQRGRETWETNHQKKKRKRKRKLRRNNFLTK